MILPLRRRRHKTRGDSPTLCIWGDTTNGSKNRASGTLDFRYPGRLVGLIMGRAMTDPSVASDLSSLPWLERIRGRLTAVLFAAIVGVLVTFRLPIEVRVVVVLDLAALTYLGLFFALAVTANPQQSAELGRLGEPSGKRVLISTVILSCVSVALVITLVDSQQDAGKVLKVAHSVASVLALFLTWLLAHIFFAVEYMKIYYDDAPVPAGKTPDPGLDYPNRPRPDMVDFMYFAFTIAMCYQTSDVSIVSVTTRRLVLWHAIFSFLFIVIIFSMVINVMGNFI